MSGWGERKRRRRKGTEIRLFANNSGRPEQAKIPVLKWGRRGAGRSNHCQNKIFWKRGKNLACHNKRHCNIWSQLLSLALVSWYHTHGTHVSVPCTKTHVSTDYNYSNDSLLPFLQVNRAHSEQTKKIPPNTVWFYCRSEVLLNYGYGEQSCSSLQAGA